MSTKAPKREPLTVGRLTKMLRKYAWDAVVDFKTEEGNGWALVEIQEDVTTCGLAVANSGDQLQGSKITLVLQ